MTRTGDSKPLPEKETIPTRIADEAARWFAERDSGLLSDESELLEWLALDPRHARAFSEMEEIWSDLGEVRAMPEVRASLVKRPRQRFRPWSRLPASRAVPRWLPTTVAASVAAIILVSVSDLPLQFQSDAMTATGEQRSISLPDGSKIMLNTDSAVSYDYGQDHRTVRLLRGEAAFTVAPDRVRPFSVMSGDGSATALGTRFLVRADDDTTRVTVTEHRVRVRDGSKTENSVDVAEGQSIAYGAGKQFGPPSKVNAVDAEAWTQGMLVFENQPLSEVIAELGRYHTGYIRLIGNDLQDRRVSGVFNIHDPLSALAKIERTLGLHSTRLTDRLIFIYT